MTPSSNAQFLAEIFGTLPADVRPMVTGFAGDPRDATDRGRKWSGWPWMPGAACDDPSLNWFFTLATYAPSEAGVYRRRAAQFVALHGVMLDDIGSRSPLARLEALPPSALVQTSHGNYQALYLFSAPLTDKAAADALQDALISAFLCDPGADGPSARNCRLPFGMNGKHSPPHRCALIEWQPELRYTVDDIVRGFSLTALAPKPPRESTASASAEWISKSQEQQREAFADLQSALAAIPSDDRKEWVAVGHYLRTLPDEIGYSLFDAWSRKAATFDEDGLNDFWGFSTTRASYRSVFALAETYGWVNPRGRAALDPAVTFRQKYPMPAGASLVPLVPAALPAVAPFIEVDVSDLAHAANDQLWWCESYLPAGHVTLLGGHGGAGKSTIALMLAVSIAIGRPFMGLQTRRGRVLFFSAEDQGSLVRRRLQKICREFDVNPSELAQTLYVLDATEAAPVLFTEQRTQGVRAGLTTSTYQALAAYVEAQQIDVLLADNASDVFDGDEINRALVRGFIRSLALIVRPRNGAVLLLAHVDKLTSRAGRSASSESYSGSTAWHNSVRSRLFLLESGAGLLELQHQKSNLGPKRGPLTLAWLPDRLPQLVSSPLPGSVLATDTSLRELLTLIAEFYSRGEYLSPAPNSTASAPAMLKGQATYPANLKPAQVTDLLRDAERRQLLTRETYKDKSRHDRVRWQITAAGVALITDVAGSAGSAAST